MHHYLGVRTGDAVMQTEEDVNGSQSVVGAHQLEFLIFCEVAQVSGAELPISDENSDGKWVLGIVVARRVVCAGGIRLPGTG